jgi:hypothetical protein
VLDRLHLLVESSLVRVFDGGSDERRFGLPETVREYADGQLIDSGEAATGGCVRPAGKAGVAGRRRGPVCADTGCRVGACASPVASLGVHVR